MTLQGKGIFFVAPLVLLLGACSSGSDTGKTDSNGGDSNGGDSNGGDSNGGDSNGGDSNGGDSNGGAETGTAITNFYGHFLTNNGNLTGGEFGLSAIQATSMTGTYSDLNVLCTLAGQMQDLGDATPCASCDWAFDIKTSNSVVSGSTCADIPWADGDFDDWSGNWGFTEAYDGGYYTYEDIVWYYFPSPYYAWYPVAYTIGGYSYGGYSTGTAEDATFHLPTSYYYYFYP